MITEAELGDTKFCCQLIINITNFYVFKKQKIFPEFFWKKWTKNKTIQMRARNGQYCPIT